MDHTAPPTAVAPASDPPMVEAEAEAAVASERVLDPSEAALIASAMASNHAAVEELWRAHRRWIAGVLMAHKPAWADVEDLLQEVALSLVRKVHELRDPAAFRPWLRTVAINAAHAAGRSGARRRRALRPARGPDGMPVEDAPDRAPQHDDHAASNESGRSLLELARTLPEGYGEPLILKAVHNLSYREIGAIMGLPETTIETRIARGRKQLRALAASLATSQSRREHPATRQGPLP